MLALLLRVAFGKEDSTEQHCVA